MLRGLWRLTWLEIKIFVREPLGRVRHRRRADRVVRAGEPGRPDHGSAGPRRPCRGSSSPICRSLVSIFLAISAVLSLVAIIAIYREGGILKRLRATPLRPHTILTAHVLVKLLFTALTLAGDGRGGTPLLPGRRPGARSGRSRWRCSSRRLCILSVGFLIASVVPTARFAQPVGALVLYPMLGLSGLFVPVDLLPPLLQAVARLLPLTYAVSLLRGIWRGDGWLAHGSDVAVLVATFVDRRRGIEQGVSLGVVATAPLRAERALTVLEVEQRPLGR